MPKAPKVLLYLNLLSIIIMKTRTKEMMVRIIGGKFYIKLIKTLRDLMLRVDGSSLLTVPWKKSIDFMILQIHRNSIK